MEKIIKLSKIVKVVKRKISSIRRTIEAAELRNNFQQVKNLSHELKGIDFVMCRLNNGEELQ